MKDDRNPRALAALPDDALIDAVQRQTFRYFWDGADGASGLALDRRTLAGDTADDKVAIGGSGFGIMALIVAIERGWNDCVIACVLAAAAPRHAVDPRVYHHGFAAGSGFVNGRSYYGIELPLGMPYGGALFFTHYSFCGLDPRGLKDRYADYWDL